jgi:hypothetical protein
MFAHGRKKSRQQIRSAKCRFFKPALEALENRTLPSLASAISGSIGGEPTAPRVGDFNGDGLPDIVTVDPSKDTVTVILGKGNGSFGNPVSYPAGPGVSDVAIADLNGDHKQDLIVADYGTPGTANSGGVSVLLGNGDGTFQKAVFTPTGSQPLYIVARDFNGDGRMDIALASDYVANFTTGGSVDVLLGTGTGGFSLPVHYVIGALPSSLAVGDFTGDGKLDVAVAGSGAAPLSLLRGQGNGTFLDAINSNPSAITPVSLTAGDFNGDGKTDLAMIDATTGLVDVALSSGNGTFQAPVAYDLGPATRLMAADVTGDGIPDLITVGGGASGVVTIAAGKGDGTFLPVVQYAAGVSQPDSIALGDFAGNGRLSVAAISSTTGAVGVLLNTPPAQIQFSAPTYSVSESISSVTITVTRSGSSAGTATVVYTTSDGTAQAGVNYQTTSGSLLWADGDTSPKTFAIPILNDGKPDGNKTVNLALSSPGGDATVAGQTTAQLLILNANFRQDKLVGQAADSGQWWLTLPGPGGVTSSLQGTWAPNSANLHWVNVMTGDFNGDGHTDVVGQVQETGQWWVSVSTAAGFFTTLWAQWDPSITWVDVHVGDFTGDGKDDIVARNAATGQWWVGVSTGTRFLSSIWGTWSPAVTWVDVQVGDLTGNGKMDIVGRVKDSGQWWAGVSTGSAFKNALWATWAPDSPSLTWVDIRIGDLTGSGRADIIGRVLQSGQWWAGISTGTSFTNQLWGHWSVAVTWTDVMLGDLTGNGKMDLVGRVVQSGQWWVGMSTGSGIVNSLWGVWSPTVTWVDVQLGDFNADGMMDIIGRTQGSSQWWLASSTGSAFVTSIYTTWDAGMTWINVHKGTFA